MNNSGPRNSGICCEGLVWVLNIYIDTMLCNHILLAKHDLCTPKEPCVLGLCTTSTLQGRTSCCQHTKSDKASLPPHVRTSQYIDARQNHAGQCCIQLELGSSTCYQASCLINAKSLKLLLNTEAPVMMPNSVLSFILAPEAVAFSSLSTT